MNSTRAKLARRILEALTCGYTVPPSDALQLRNWAVNSEDAMLSLEEIAYRILSQEENPKAKAVGRR